MRHLVLLPLVCTAILSTSTLATSDEFHLHRVDAAYDKCFEASSRSQFANKHLPDTGKCPSSYNTVDELVTILQCPDGVTSIRDCSPINVTIATKAETHQLRPMALDDDRCSPGHYSRNLSDDPSPCVRGNWIFPNDTAKCILNGCPCEHGYDCVSSSCVSGICQKTPMGAANGNKGCITELLLLAPYCLKIGASPPIRDFCKGQFDFSCPGIQCCGVGDGNPGLGCCGPRCPKKNHKSGPQELCLCMGICDPHNPNNGTALQSQEIFPLH